MVNINPLAACGYEQFYLLDLSTLSTFHFHFELVNILLQAWRCSVLNLALFLGALCLSNLIILSNETWFYVGLFCFLTVN